MEELIPNEDFRKESPSHLAVILTTVRKCCYVWNVSSSAAHAIRGDTAASELGIKTPV